MKNLVTYSLIAGVCFISGSLFARSAQPIDSRDGSYVSVLQVDKAKKSKVDKPGKIDKAKIDKLKKEQKSKKAYGNQATVEDSAASSEMEMAPTAE